MSNVHRKKDVTLENYSMMEHVIVNLVSTIFVMMNLLLSLLHTDYVAKIKYWNLPTVTTVSFKYNQRKQ
jgi:TRAP-type mannitol/chloroaromatic compound transport system permease small subunit